ncbi:hypothetical protein A4G23_01908 [Streptomyces rubrolavendulae]|uniref:DUF1707 domain-containing protein n=1 Tax=Streptomyces rubrolavendulae TaxID=285473 RepID=A0A1D8G0U3_9ACTN|nr:hypothetical protein A4G23_01908 [Streptomyces rubrolavendulae]
MTDPERLPGRPQHPEDPGPDRPVNPDAPAHGAPASGTPASDAPTGPAPDGPASGGPASGGPSSGDPAPGASAHGAPDVPGAPVPAEAPLPAGPGAMRASDTEREAVAERLRDALAEGRLDMAEFDERLDAAYRAKTHGELVPLVRDLPAPAGGPAAPAHAPSGGWAARIGRPATSRSGVAVFGGFGRGGRWSVGRAFTAVAVMGGGDIDLRDADFEDREIVIRCFALMGGVSVVVPPDLDVEVSGIGLMGGFDDRATGPGTPGSPRVRITGLALMGGVEVKRKPRKGEKSRNSLEK